MRVPDSIDGAAVVGERPAMRRLRLVIVLLAVACTRRAPPPAGAVSKEKLAAFRRCNEALAQNDDAPLPAGDSRSARLARACADVYSEPACAAAMRNPPRDVAAIASAIAEACRHAYCPRLPEPRPALCAGELPPPVEMLRRWRELQTRIIALELGVAPEVVEALAPPTRFTVSKQLVPPAPRAPALGVRVTGDGRNVHVAIEGQKQTVALAAGGKDDALVALFRRVRAAAPAGTGIALDAERAVGYDAVIRVLDDLHAAGFTDVEFASAQP